MRLTKLRACGKRQINQRDLPTSQRRHFTALRVAQTARGVKHIRAGANAQIKLALLGLIGSARKRGFQTRRKNAPPCILQVIHGIEQLLTNSLSAQITRGHALQAIQHGLLNFIFGKLVSQRNSGVGAKCGAIVLSQAPTLGKIIRSTLHVVLIIHREQGQRRVARQIHIGGVNGQLQFQFQHFHAVFHRLLRQFLWIKFQPQRPRLGGWNDIGQRVHVQVWIIDQALQVALAQTQAIIRDDDIFNPATQSAFRADNFNLRRVAGVHTPARQLQLRQRKFILLLTNIQFTRGGVHIPIRPVHIGKQANGFQLCARVGNLAVQLCHTDTGGVGFNSRASQQRLANGKCKATLPVVSASRGGHGWIILRGQRLRRECSTRR